MWADYQNQTDSFAIDINPVYSPSHKKRKVGESFDITDWEWQHVRLNTHTLTSFSWLYRQHILMLLNIGRASRFTAINNLLVFRRFHYVLYKL